MGSNFKQVFTGAAKMIGTTNIAVIRMRLVNGKRIFHLAGDGRITSGNLIKTEKYEKLLEISKGIHMTICGRIKLCEKLVAHIKDLMKKYPEEFKTIEEFATSVNNFFKIETENARNLLGEKPELEDDIKVWETNFSRWQMLYHNSLSFIGGFDSNQIPKVYVANAKYKVPLDISKNYTAAQIRLGISETEASNAIDKIHSHFFVRGSYSKGVTQYLEESTIFKRISEEFEDIENLDVLQRSDDTISDADIHKELSKAIVYASLNDSYTGGDFVVKTVSNDGVCISTTKGNVIQYYLENFDEFDTDCVLWLLVEFKPYNDCSYKNLADFLIGCAGYESRFQPVGKINDSLIFYVLRLMEIIK